jgi:ubiquinone/menaquinone biosynthesis C-methylase UbiE
MSRDDATRAYYDDFSKWYERERGRGYHALIDDLEFELTAPYARGKRCLEVGCGTGLILERVAAVASEAVGIDLSPGMLEKARDRGLTVHEAPATKLPFEDGRFDVVYSFKVLAHVPEIETALAEMARVCAPGGTLLAEFYNPYSLRYLAKTLGPAQKVSETRTEAAVYTRFDAPARIRAMVPAGTTLVDFHGVRVFTPTARAVTLPVLGPLLQRAEHLALRSPLARLGGFLVAVMRRDG